MAQNITLLGASYSDVPAVQLPKTGGGTATFTDTSDTTAEASDVTQGKYFYTASGVRTPGTSTGGGGGASNYVTGTFKGTTTGAAMDVNIPYTGTGYPIAVMIYPTNGYNGGAFGDLLQRYAIGQYCGVKRYMSTVPTYSTNQSDLAYFVVNTAYKNSNSSASSYSGAQNATATTAQNKDASGTSTLCVTLKSNTKMSVFIASTSYGFAANIEYTYRIIYSS